MSNVFSGASRQITFYAFLDASRLITSYVLFGASRLIISYVFSGASRLIISLRVCSLALRFAPDKALLACGSIHQVLTHFSHLAITYGVVIMSWSFQHDNRQLMTMCSVLSSYCICRRPRWTPKTQPNDSSAVVWLSFWCSTRFTRKKVTRLKLLTVKSIT